MLTISLDETGTFEYSENAKERVGIVGGVIFSCGSSSDVNDELDRLQKYFRTICEELGKTYPNDLHFNRDSRNEIINLTEALEVKRKLEEELPDFLNGVGKWKKNPPAGKYALYAIVTDKCGMEYEPGKGNLVDDDVASNRYEHMVYRVMENLILLNPELSDQEIKLELATRSYVPKDNQEKQEYEAAYSTNRNKESYSVTNTAGYKAALASAIQESDRSDINVDLNVQSINYNEGKSNLPHGFLFMADTICSVYANAVGTIGGTEKALDMLYQRCSEILSEDRVFLYSYSRSDHVFHRAFKAAKQGNYFQALKEINQAELKGVRGTSYYGKTWFRQVENMIHNENSVIPLQIALTQLDHYLNTAECNYITATYIYEQLKKHADQLSLNQHATEPILFRLYRTKIKICNHKGDYLGALSAYEKCVSKAQYVSVEEYLELRNLYCVSLQDYRRFPEALSCIKETITYEEMLNDMRKEIYPGNDKVFIHYGRTCSLMGQCYAFTCKYEEATLAFEKAIQSFGNDKMERAFTLSLYLHMLIEKGDMEQYERYAKEYFGTGDLREQFDNIWKPDEKSPKFMLYVYIKALFVLYRDSSKCKGKFFKKITKKIEAKYIEEPDAHPWEMILKYCAFLELHSNDYQENERANMFMARSNEVIEGNKGETEGTLEVIMAENNRQYESLCKGKTLKEIFDESELTYMYR